MGASLDVHTSRYDRILSDLLGRLSTHHELPAALLEYVAMEGAVDSPDALPAQPCHFVAQPGIGTETLDLLMCAAGTGCAKTTQLLLECGAPRAQG